MKHEIDMLDDEYMTPKQRAEMRAMRTELPLWQEMEMLIEATGGNEEFKAMLEATGGAPGVMSGTFSDNPVAAFGENAFVGKDEEGNEVIIFRKDTHAIDCFSTEEAQQVQTGVTTVARTSSVDSVSGVTLGDGTNTFAEWLAYNPDYGKWTDAVAQHRAINDTTGMESEE